MKNRCLRIPGPLTVMPILAFLAMQGALAAPDTAQHKTTPRTTHVFWGDTHLHSSFSFDAYPFGNESIGPGEAFSFARGKAVVSAGTGQTARLSRPLDWPALYVLFARRTHSPQHMSLIIEKLRETIGSSAEDGSVPDAQDEKA